MKYNVELYQSPDYKRSRLAYMNQCHFEWFIHMLAMDAFLAKLLTYVGIDDSLIGVISTIASLSGAFQLLSFFVVPRIHNTKRFVFPVQIFGELMFVSLYMIPLLSIDAEIKSILMVCSIIFAYLGYQLSNSVTYRWGNSFVDPHHRAEYSTKKEMISGLLGMVVSLAAGHMLDVLDGQGSLKNGFLFAAIAMLIFTVCEIICLALIKNEVRPKQISDTVPIQEVLQKTVGNPNFRNLALLFSVFNFALYFTLGFLGTYMINPNELAFSVGAVSLMDIASNVARSFFTKAIGRYSDRNSFAKGIELGMILYLIGFVMVMFTVPQTRYLIILFMILKMIATAGAGSNFVNCVYSYVDSRCFSQARAVMSTLSGICAFIASILGSRLLAAIQANGNSFLGIPVYGQQVLAAVSCIILLCCIAFNRLVLEKQEIMVQ